MVFSELGDKRSLIISNQVYLRGAFEMVEQSELGDLSKVVVGIDLGTTFSCVAYYNPTT